MAKATDNLRARMLPTLDTAVERGTLTRDEALAVLDMFDQWRALHALADQWNSTPDYTASEYDKGRVDQRHDMTTQLLEALSAPHFTGAARPTPAG